MRRIFAVSLAIVAACAAPPVRRADVRDAVATTPDGVRIAYDVRGAGEPTLVFVHCWCGDREFWREQLDEFAAAHRVVALDLSAHGASGAHATPSLEALGSDVVAVVDALELEHCVLIGHSLGGPASLQAASRLTGRVVAVIGVETMHDVEVDIPRAALEAWIASLERDFRGQVQQSVRAMLPAATERELVAWITRKACAARAADVTAISRALVGVDLRALLASAKVPVRCINSAAHPPAIQATEIERNRAYADFDALLLAGTGHFPQLERPREFNAALRSVLERLRMPAELGAARP